jgi:hypothetical protein
VFRRVNVQPAERDPVAQINGHSLLKASFHFEVMPIPCRPKMDNGKAMSRDESRERFVREIGHC